jgi:hypothetical protein
MSIELQASELQGAANYATHLQLDDDGRVA